MRSRSLVTLGALAVAATALTSCSQIGALKQVSGVPLTTLTIAANDVLVSNKIPVMTAPTCVLTTSYTCTGKTLAGEAIIVTAPDTENLTMTVKVGSKQIYTGSVQAIIEQSQQGAS